MRPAMLILLVTTICEVSAKREPNVYGNVVETTANLGLFFGRKVVKNWRCRSLRAGQHHDAADTRSAVSSLVRLPLARLLRRAGRTGGGRGDPDRQYTSLVGLED